jgi:hypothetical protein
VSDQARPPLTPIQHDFMALARLQQVSAVDPRRSWRLEHDAASWLYVCFVYDPGDHSRPGGYSRAEAHKLSHAVHAALLRAGLPGCGPEEGREWGG